MKDAYLGTTAAAPAMLPPEPEILPPEPPTPLVRDPNEVILFEDDDVRQALKILDGSPFDRIAAMRDVMMFALQVAAINLNVK